MLPSASLSALLAVSLIAAAFIGATGLFQQIVPGIETAGRIDPSRPSSARGIPWPSSRDLMFEGSAAGKEGATAYRD
jgi:hypothetical protein